MASNIAQTERAEFSARLQQTLAMRDYAPDSPTVLAREFNIRFSGKPVTVHAARKWLVGESIPTQEKLRLLAEWLSVSVQWLRYGDDSGQTKEGKEPKAIKDQAPASLRFGGRHNECIYP